MITKPLPQDLKLEYQQLIATLRAVHAFVADVNARVQAMDYNPEEYDLDAENDPYLELCAWALAIELELDPHIHWPVNPDAYVTEVMYGLPEGWASKVNEKFEAQRDLVGQALGTSR